MNHIRLQDMLKDFLNEDIGQGDLSSELLFPVTQQGTLRIVAKDTGIFCGAIIIEQTFRLLDATAHVAMKVRDGESIKQGDEIAVITGAIHALLKGERTMLNLIQRMCAISTATYHANQLIQHTSTKVCDTRKTMPGLRMLDKYAVRVGGGLNHRSGLYDAVMLKDNHIAFAGGITQAVTTIKSNLGHMSKIEVEIETLQQLQEAIRSNVDVIMFDNCTPQQIKDWLPLVPPHIVTEASGGITVDNLISYAETGVSLISLGELTHSVKAFDLSARVSWKGE